MFAENLHFTTDSLPPREALLLLLIVLKFSWSKKILREGDEGKETKIHTIQLHKASYRGQSPSLLGCLGNR